MYYSNPVYYLRDGYEVEIRDAICSKCGSVIGEQVMYIDLYEEEFHFEDREVDKWRFCPYCGVELMV